MGCLPFLSVKSAVGAGDHILIIKLGGLDN